MVATPQIVINQSKIIENLSLLQFWREVIDRQPEKSRGCDWHNYPDQNTASRSVKNLLSLYPVEFSGFMTFAH